MSTVVTDESWRDIARFAPISLAELQDQAELLTRRDRKYLLTGPDLEVLLARLPESRVLEIAGRRRFTYDTVYFDTPDFRSYLDAARGRRARWKVRTRTYREQREVWTEIKVRDRRGRTTKFRREREATDPWALVAGDRAFAVGLADGTRLTTDAIAHLEAILSTSYERITLFDPASAGRLTIDLGLRCELVTGSAVILEGAAIVETKSSGRPMTADRLLWRMRRRPVRLSKYCTSFAALRPELPSHRWHRTLRSAPYRSVTA